jgi:hypothetical protein
VLEMAHLLLIAKDYWGTCKAVDTARNLETELCKHTFFSSTIELINDVVNAESVKAAFSQLCMTLSLPEQVGIVYMIGHGNQIPDNDKDEEDGMDEVYQLPDGNVEDDTLTGYVNQIDPSSKIILISDHCSSGTMFDKNKTKDGINWVSISSSLPYEDSYTSGDGNAMTSSLISVLGKTGIKLTVRDLNKELIQNMKDSWVGELQHPCITVSNDTLWDEPLVPV